MHDVRTRKCVNFVSNSHRENRMCDGVVRLLGARPRRPDQEGGLLGGRRGPGDAVGAAVVFLAHRGCGADTKLEPMGFVLISRTLGQLYWASSRSGC